MVINRDATRMALPDPVRAGWYGLFEYRDTAPGCGEWRYWGACGGSEWRSPLADIIRWVTWS